MSAKHDPFGVLAFFAWDHDWNHHHFNEAILLKAARQLQSMGLSFVRLDYYWSDIDRGVGLYDFSKYDRITQVLRDHDLNILGILHYNKHQPDANNGAWNHPPDSFDEFAAYVHSTVSRYKNDVTHWEIWNEPNHPEYWAVPMDGLQTYSRLLTLSYAAAKKADPHCLVLNGGLTASIAQDVENLYRAAGNKVFDILNIHPFINPLKENPEKIFDDIIRAVRSTMEKHEDKNKKIWITEMERQGIPSR